MATKQTTYCDNCNKAVLPDDYDKLPDSWRQMIVPFDDAAPLADVCSPGCAKAIANKAIDEEWELPERNGVADRLASFDNPGESTTGSTSIRSRADAQLA